MCAKGPNLRAQSWNIASTTGSMTQKAKKGCSQMEKSPPLHRNCILLAPDEKRELPHAGTPFMKLIMRKR